MKVVGFSYKKISAEKKKEISKSMNINTDMKILDLKEGKLSQFGDKKSLSVDYQFQIDWQPDFATLLFEGSIIFLLDEENDEELFKKTMAQWKTKKLPEDLGTNLLRIIFSRCNLKALQLEEYLGLPPHVPSPQFSKDENPSPNKKQNKNV